MKLVLIFFTLLFFGTAFAVWQNIETTTNWPDEPKQFTVENNTTMTWPGEPAQFETEVTRQPCPHPNPERMCNGN